MKARQLFLQCLPDLDEHESQALFFLIIEHLTGLDRTHALLTENHGITSDLETAYLDVLHALSLGVPVQYALGAADFCGLRIKVNKNVLIPRPETQELVRLALVRAKNNRREPFSVLDIGTGSGCIAIALDHLLRVEKKTLLIDAVDVSPAALRTARSNAQALGADIHFELANVLMQDFLHRQGDYDLIISNPPYIRHSESATMERNVLDYEPHQALFVPDDDPLRFYRAIARYASRHLKKEPDSALWLEINQALGDETSRLVSSFGFHCQIMQDSYGKDRFLCATPV